MTPSFLLSLFLIIVIGDFILDKTLDWLNYRSMDANVPNRLSDVYDADQYQKSIHYNRESSRFSFFTSGLSFILLVIILATGAFGWLDSYLLAFIEVPIYRSIAFFGILFIASDLLGTPFQWYSTFVIEEKYGFNNSTPKIFIFDKLKGYLLTIIIGGPLLFILLRLLEYVGPDFWVWFWLVITAFTLFMNVFYTTLILPLFNKLSPLEDGELKSRLEEYSQSVGFPLRNIFVIDGSKRSKKSNAFFSGLGKKKKIVLYDTLIKNHSVEEIVAILAHEVGHYKKKHIIYGFIISILQTGFMLYLMSLLVFSQELSLAMGGSVMAFHLNLLAIAILFSPISHITGIFGNLFSRKNEYEADYFAATTYSGSSLQLALKKLSSDNLSNLTPHKAYVFMHYSHPTLLQRLEALDGK